MEKVTGRRTKADLEKENDELRGMLRQFHRLYTNNDGLNLNDQGVEFFTLWIEVGEKLGVYTIGDQSERTLA